MSETPKRTIAQIILNQMHLLYQNILQFPLQSLIRASQEYLKVVKKLQRVTLQNYSQNLINPYVFSSMQLQMNNILQTTLAKILFQQLASGTFLVHILNCFMKLNFLNNYLDDSKKSINYTGKDASLLATYLSHHLFQHYTIVKQEPGNL